MYVQGNVTPAVEITGLTYGEEAKDWVSHHHHGSPEGRVKGALLYPFTDHN